MTRSLRTIVTATLLWWAACRGQVVGYDDDGRVIPPPDGRPDIGVDAQPDARPDRQVPDPCSPEGTEIYAVSHEHELYRFHPPSHQFTLVSTLDCPTPGQPFSMAVSLYDYAYVLYYSPTPPWTCVGVNQVDIVTGECLAQTPFDCQNTAGFQLFGMGFAKDGTALDQETLYISDQPAGTPRLGILDLETWTPRSVANIGAPAQSSAELVGDGSGALWGFFGWDPAPFFARLDKQTGGLDQQVTVAQSNPGWAMAAARWGGDFYLFVGTAAESTALRVRNGNVTEHTSYEFTIVGAGNSICVPDDPDDE